MMTPVGVVLTPLKALSILHLPIRAREKLVKKNTPSQKNKKHFQKMVFSVILNIDYFF